MQSPSRSCHPQTSTHISSQPQLKQYFPRANQTVISKSIFTDCQILSVIDRSFIAIHYQKGIYLIDQHAACQKLLYMEKYQQVKQYRPTKKVTGKYCIPNVYCKLLVQNEGLVNYLGWHFTLKRQSGTFTEINISKQPFILTQTIGETQLIFYLQQLYELQDMHVPNIKYQQQHCYQWVFRTIDISQKQKQILAEYACHHSYRFGDELSLKKAEQIVRKLGLIQAPFNCPHSRVLISYYGDVQQLGLSAN